MREAHAIANLLYEGLGLSTTNGPGLCKLLQPLVEQLAVIDIWHCQYVTTVPCILLLALGTLILDGFIQQISLVELYGKQRSAGPVAL